MTLFGYGKTTKEIAKKFKNKKIKIYDNKFKEVTEDEFGNKLIPMEQFNPNESDLEVISPGIAPHNPIVKKAKNLISEYDLFSDNMPFNIWISGTNGKTTTTQMLTHLLKHRGAISGGNIGTPLATMDVKAPIWILETSSFTLHYTNKAKPNIYILLPISQDHIDWHEGFENYKNAKLKPLEFMYEGEAIILPKKYMNRESAGFKIGYENSKDLAEYFDIDLNKINFKEPFLFDSIIALGVSKILFDEVNYNLINSFKVDAHKVEKFQDRKNRIWIDDSKATNIDATIEALKNFINQKVYLILGGDSKGANLEPLFNFIVDNNIDINIFAIGKSANEIQELSIKYNLESIITKELKIAVDEISKLHNSNSIAILSPACASLDQFKSYKDRGEKFKKYVLPKKSVKPLSLDMGI